MKLKYVYDFPRPSVTATIALLGSTSTFDHDVKARVLTGIRGRKDGAYAGFRCIPGGFLDAKVDEKDLYMEEEDDQEVTFNLRKLIRVAYTMAERFLKKFVAEHTKPGETIEQTAVREVFEETGIVITEDRLRLFWVHSNPNTDPRAHVVNVCYWVLLTEDEIANAKAGDDLESLELITLRNGDPIPTMAFNHADILDRAISDSLR